MWRLLFQIVTVTKGCAEMLRGRLVQLGACSDNLCTMNRDACLWLDREPINLLTKARMQQKKHQMQSPTCIAEGMMPREVEQLVQTTWCAWHCGIVD